MKGRVDRTTSSNSAMAMRLYSRGLSQLLHFHRHQAPEQGSMCRIPVCTSRLYFSWRDFNQNMPFTAPVSPAQLTVGVVLTSEEGLLLPLLDFYTDFICKMAAEAIFFYSTLYGLAVQVLRHCWPQTFAPERHIEGYSPLSLSYELKGQCLCGCQRVCVQIVFCTWKEESVCTITFRKRCISVHCVSLWELNYSCLYFIAHFSALCYYSLYQILNLRIHRNDDDKSRPPPSFLMGVRTLQVWLS